MFIKANRTVLPAWFKNQVYDVRIRRAMTVVILCQIASMACLSFAVNFQLTANFSSLGNAFFSFTIWSFIRLAAIIFIAIFIFTYHCRHFRVVPFVETSKWHVIQKLVDCKAIKSYMFFCASGLTMAVILLNLRVSTIDTDMLAKMRPWDISETSFFLALSGAYTGFVFAYRYRLSLNYVRTAIVRDSKFYTVRRALGKTFVDSACNSFKDIYVFFLIYAYFGLKLKWILIEKFNLQITDGSSEFGFLTNVYFLMSFRLLFVTWLINTVLLFNWHFYLRVFEIYVTEPVHFPVEEPLIGDNSRILTVAMGTGNHPLVRHLAFMDLATISKYSRDRRLQIYALSQPGGHPTNWINVSGQCVDLLNKLKEQLAKKDHLKPAKSQCDAAESIYNVSYERYLRPDIVHKQQMEGIPRVPVVMSPLEVVYRNKRIQFCNYLRSSKAVSYFFDPTPNCELRSAFAHSLPAAFAVEALSNLLVNSLTEDNYGVVQKHIGPVTGILLDLQFLVNANTPLSYMRGAANAQRECFLLQKELKTVLNAAIYRISMAFSPYLKNLDLTEAQKQRLHACNSLT